MVPIIQKPVTAKYLCQNLKVLNNLNTLGAYCIYDNSKIYHEGSSIGQGVLGRHFLHIYLKRNSDWDVVAIDLKVKISVITFNIEDDYWIRSIELFLTKNLKPPFNLRYR